jgi:rod shape-determining protein MreC
MLRLLGKYRHALGLTACLLLGTALLSAQQQDAARLAWVEQLAMAVASPVERFVVGGTRAVRHSWERHFQLAHLAEENRVLRAKLEAVQAEAHHIAQVEAENERLAHLLHFAPDNTDLPMVVAQVIGREVNSWYEAIDLNRGVTDGVHAGLAVITNRGVVGVVHRAAANHCRVRLITDPASSLPVLLEQQREKCILAGQSRGCRLKYLESGTTVVPGDAVITSGYGGIFPKGLLVGRVRTVSDPGNALFQAVEVEPSVDLSRLEEVFVFLQTSQGDDSLAP